MKTIFLFTCILLVTNCYGQKSENLKNLKKELAEIYRTDQLYRKEMAKHKPTDIEIVRLSQQQDSLDAVNLKKAIAILDTVGFPEKKIFGDTAGLALFHVIQHNDIKYQNKYLPLFKKAARKNELGWNWIAMMIDRIKFSKGEKQIYGTQIDMEKDPKTGFVTNRISIYPIADEKNVNTRRAKMGLKPIEEEAKEFGIVYRLKQ